MTKLADWEITAGGSTINSAAPTGAPEGMAPSAINNKIREDNAVIARDYRNRKGILSAGGTSSAYTLTSAEGDAGDNLTTGDAAMLVFVANKKCEAGVTLAVDGMAAKSIIDASGNNLSEGDITANTLVSVCYNAGTDRWQIMNERASTDAVRAGDATTFTGDNSFEGDSTFKGSAQFQSSIFTQAATFDAGLNSVNYMDNLALVASVAGNNLTIDVRGKDLSDPSNTNKVNVAFRSENAADGDYDIVSITSALDITIDAGETLGFSASEDGYVYVYLMNNAGTVVMAVAKKALFDESVVQSSTVLDPSADDDSTLYSTVAQTSIPIRLIGRLRITHGSDVWDAAPTELSVWHPGMKKTGDIVNQVITVDGEYATGTGTIAADDSIPQNTEGDEYMTLAITPKSTINDLLIEVNAALTSSVAFTTVMALFQDSTADALAASLHDIAAANGVETNVLLHSMKTGTVSSTTFKVRAGATSAATTYFNGFSAARKLGGVMSSFIKITEIQA